MANASTARTNVTIGHSFLIEPFCSPTADALFARFPCFSANDYFLLLGSSRNSIALHSACCISFSSGIKIGFPQFVHT